MIVVRELNREDHKAVCALIKTVESALANNDWFIPMPETALTHMFDENSTLTVYGAEVDGVLAGISLIDSDVLELSDLANALNLPKDQRGAELGVSMVLPEYRGQHLMRVICEKLVSVAREMGFDYLVASAHEDNLASDRTLLKLGMERKAKLVRHGSYARNAYHMSL